MDRGHTADHDGSEPASKTQQSKEETRATICYSSKPGSIKADPGMNSTASPVTAINYASKHDMISRKRKLPSTRELPSRFKRSTSNEQIGESSTTSTTEPIHALNTGKATEVEDDANIKPFTEIEHRALVYAIFNVGLNNSSPRAISDNMSSKIKATHSALSLEKIKSKLQKYRKSKEINTEKFMKLYDVTLARLLHAYPIEQISDAATPSSERQNRSSGEVAAYLTHAILSTGNHDHATHVTDHDEAEESHETSLETTVDLHSFSVMDQKPKSRQEADAQPFQPDWPQVTPLHITPNEALPHNERGLEFPALTAQERASPIGVQFEYFLGLFNSLRADVYQSRAAASASIDTMPSLSGSQLQNVENNAEAASKQFEITRMSKEIESNQSLAAGDSVVPGEQFLPDQLLKEHTPPPFAVADEGIAILAGLAGSAPSTFGQQWHTLQGAASANVAGTLDTDERVEYDKWGQRITSKGTI
jgi:hypothetical protein